MIPLNDSIHVSIFQLQLQIHIHFKRSIRVSQAKVEPFWLRHVNAQETVKYYSNNWC